ncbi:hypothetical protein BJ878DRAFT_123443 [Calycina marina]|uniref:Uncharacterized protein n=1 Tax=Calycina marina TaxID=1763456 RepID=A0A9P8CIF5_9HELO|nr:hypothetical protein BJ878DRAFT_123443 [Calycina marina]
MDITSYFDGNTTTLALASEFGQLLFCFDWDSTYLVPMHTWTQQLLETSKIMMTDPKMAMLFWGPHHVILHNEATIPLLGDGHLGLLGKPFKELYANVWESMSKFPYQEVNLAQQLGARSSEPPVITSPRTRDCSKLLSSIQYLVC